MLTRLARYAAMAVFMVIAFATLGPLGDRPHVGSASFERAAAYVLLGLCLGFAARRRVWLALLTVTVIAAGLELGQLLTPDRHGHAEDALVKIAGGIAGVLIARMTRRLIAGRRAG